MALKMMIALLIGAASGLRLVDNYSTVASSFKEGKSVVLILRHKLSENKEVLAEIERYFSSEDPMPAFFEVFEGTCETLSQFCETERIDGSINHAFVLRKFEHFRFDLESGSSPAVQFPLEVKDLASPAEIVAWQSSVNRRGLFLNFGASKDERLKLGARIFANSIYRLDSLALRVGEASGFEKIGAALLVSEGVEFVQEDPPKFEDLLEFVDAEAADFVITFGLENFSKVFLVPVVNKIFLIRSDTETCPERLELLEKFGRAHRSQELRARRTLFVDVLADHLRSDQPGEWKIIEALFGSDVLDEQNCRLFAVTSSRDQPLKYEVPLQVDSVESLEEFYSDMLDKKLETRFLKNEKIVAGNERIGQRIERLNSSNFKEKVIKDSQHHSFILVCKDAETCPYLIKFFELLAEKDSQKVKYFVLDASKNEVAELRTEIFPVFLFYKLGQKFKPEFLMTKFSYANLLSWYQGQLKLVGLPPVELSKQDKFNFLKSLVGKDDEVILDEDLFEDSDL